MKIGFTRTPLAQKSVGMLTVTERVQTDKNLLAQLRADGVNVKNVDIKVMATRKVLKPWYTYTDPDAVNYRVSVSFVVNPGYSEPLQSRRLVAYTFYPQDKWRDPARMTWDLFNAPTPYWLTRNTEQVIAKLTPHVYNRIHDAIASVYGLIDLAGVAMYDTAVAEHGTPHVN